MYTIKQASLTGQIVPLSLESNFLKLLLFIFQTKFCGKGPKADKTAPRHSAYDTQHNDTQHIDTEHDDTEHKGLISDIKHK